MRLPVIYALLALIATAANIGSQDLVIRAYSGAYAILLSILVGTAIGLVVKYVLDKRYIFHFKARDLGHDGRTFALYVLMGVVTTAIFWGVEFTFESLFHTKELRYVGGILGLCIGYIAKYQLDKHYVFRTGAA